MLDVRHELLFERVDAPGGHGREGKRVVERVAFAETATVLRKRAPAFATVHIVVRLDAQVAPELLHVEPHTLVVGGRELVHVAVQKQHVARLRVVLHHGAPAKERVIHVGSAHRARYERHHVEVTLRFHPGKAEEVLVAPDQLHPRQQAVHPGVTAAKPIVHEHVERGDVGAAIDEQLAALLLKHVDRPQRKRIPDKAARLHVEHGVLRSPKVGPKHGAALDKRPGIEQWCRVAQREIVGVQEQDRVERAVEYGVQLGVVFDGVGVADFPQKHAVVALQLGQNRVRRVDLAACVPKLDGQGAAVVAQCTHAGEGAL